MKSGLLSILEKGSVFVFGFGSLYLLARMLEGVELGTWFLFGTIVSFIEVGRSGLLQNALIKYLTTSPAEEKPKIATASLFLSFCLTILCILFLLLFSEFLSRILQAPLLSSLLRIYCITTILLIPMQQFNFMQQANFDFRGIFWSNFAWKGLFFFFLAFLFFSPWTADVQLLAYYQIGTASIAGLISFLIGRPYLTFSWQIDMGWVRRLFGFGLFVFGTNLSTMLYKTLDRMMISSMTVAGAAAVGVYEIAIRFTNLVEVPTFSVASVVFPKSSEKMATEGKSAIKELYEQSVGAILALVLPFLLLVFVLAEPIIVLLATEEYLSSVPVLRTTIWFGLFIPFAVQFGTVVDSMGLPKVNFAFTLLGLVLNIVLNYLFISQMGIIGAAYGTLISYVLLFLITQIVLNRLIGTHPLNVFRHILPFYRKGYSLAYKFLNKEEETVDSVKPEA
ncbi:MAG: flippase [Bacteroidota bacterium]